MAWNRARGDARRTAALLCAALLLVAVAPLPAVAGTTSRTKFTALPARGARTVAHVDALASTSIRPRTVPAAAQLHAKARPPIATGAPGNTRTTKTVTPLVVPPPPLTVARTIFTQAQHDVLLEPPDPWVVANPSYVLASSNGLVRVMNRTGSTLGNIPTFVLFDSDAGHFESDPRILWDAAHGRWVGVVVTYDYPAYADTSITLVVSDTASPLGGWTVHRLDYANDMPDYPGIASTSDKIALTANLYLNGSDTGYDGSSMQFVSWASLIAGGTVASDPMVCANCWNFRPARNSGAATADALLVYEDTNTDTLWLLKASGPVTAIDTSLDKNLLIAAGYYGPAGVGFDHQPRQPGGTVSNAVDGRIPDVAMSGDTVYFARTNQADLGGTVKDLVLQVYAVSASAAFAGTLVPRVRTWGQKNEDYWMPGVGISKGDATAGTGFYLSFMRSTDTVSPEAYAAGSLDGNGFTDPALIAASSAPYTSTYGRWGDFMGITPDTNGTMAVWSATEVSGADGRWQEVVDRLVLDDTPPVTAAGVPTQSLVAGTQLGANNVPVKVAFTGTTDPQSGIRSYLVSEDAFGGAVVVAGTSFVEKVAAYTYGDPGAVPDRFSVSSLNDAGLWGPDSAWGVPLTASIFQQTRTQFVYSSGWSSQSSSSFSGGSTKYSAKAGASATFRVSGRSFGWVSYKASTRGKAKVYLDGVYKGTFSLKSSTTKARSLAYVANFATNGTHTIKIVVYAGRVDVDGFVVLR